MSMDLVRAAILIIQIITVMLAAGVVAQSISSRKFPGGILDWLVIIAAIVIFIRK